MILLMMIIIILLALICHFCWETAEITRQFACFGSFYLKHNEELTNRLDAILERLGGRVDDEDDDDF